MDAPIYPPAAAYIEPVAVPVLWTTANIAMADLVSAPELMVVLLDEMPGAAASVERAAKHPILANFTPRALVPFGMFKADALDRVDARLRLLPARVIWR